MASAGPIELLLLLALLLLCRHRCLQESAAAKLPLYLV